MGVSCRTFRRLRGQCDYGSCRGPSSSGVVGSSGRCVDVAPRVGVVLAGELHENPISCWLDTINCWIMADQVKWEYTSTGRTVVPVGRGVGDAD